MSLLEEAMRRFVLLRGTPVPDGAGGQRTAWEPGAAFTAALSRDTGAEERRAEQEGARSVYTVLAERTATVRYGDYFRELPDGQTYRATTDPAERQTPPCAALALIAFTAERGEPPE